MCFFWVYLSYFKENASRTHARAAITEIIRHTPLGHVVLGRTRGVLSHSPPRPSACTFGGIGRSGVERSSPDPHGMIYVMSLMS